MIGRTGARLLRNRRLMRAPIWLYRARLGFLLGSRLLLLEHVGRKTGARRTVVLEVVGHPAPDTYVVASGFGDRAQWYRNVVAEPRVRVASGARGLSPATARRLPTAEADAVLAVYVSEHRRAWRRFKTILENTLGTTISERDTDLPMVELRLDGAGS
ncbi:MULTISPECIES: nitroreductase family deazaflavin-dependent oxidoreductase [unclassified Amycolatopsis]|uniref:nitroreductase family deazaflavin-dependent oxidoreductase n=1 Tax=unclassified Amycolatopsis TaxID=2618356 RepID=UPI00210360F3|nr:nitroreductase family deazaflavin-dependent oxidoreductase [Amycolatopsis sp. DSM 110486]